MNLSFTINSESKTFEVAPKDRLLDVLRRNGYFGVKPGYKELTSRCFVDMIIAGEYNR
jgi:aerobic-type carbon monoxide dehydrogenase small subunit (CoxS/CutS family)